MLLRDIQIPPPSPSDTLSLSLSHTQGFVPATNDVFESETIIPAAYAAIDDVNADCDLLSGYLLQLDFVNTQVCSNSDLAGYRDLLIRWGYWIRETISTWYSMM